MKNTDKKNECTINRQIEIAEEFENQRNSSCNCESVILKEEAVRKKTDSKGNKWKKVYCGSGGHFKNWFEQCIEIYGEENISVEEISSSNLRCYNGSNEKMKRIWVKLPLENNCR